MSQLQSARAARGLAAAARETRAAMMNEAFIVMLFGKFVVVVKGTGRLVA